MKPFGKVRDLEWNEEIAKESAKRTLKQLAKYNKEKLMSVWKKEMPSCGGDLPDIEKYPTYEVSVDSEKPVCDHDWNPLWGAKQYQCSKCCNFMVPKGEEPINKAFAKDTWKEDLVNKPKHYNVGKYQPINVIEDWKLPYHLGNVVKYINRAKHKGSELQDLEKARWYLDRHISNLKGE